ncbi:MAG: hypothetical protein LBG52_00905, partial [Candidatus Peribacteria bacterium]|nr:hypothetical protein [Candidatus Peribacteria bacterium]
MKSFYKIMGILVCSIVSLSLSVADYLQTSTASQSLTTAVQCNGGIFPVVYYAGSSAITVSDTFQSDSSRLWRFTSASNVAVYNPNNVVQFSTNLAQAFPFYSNGKPAHINSVVITATPISISSTVPAGYTRNTMAAQLVYDIHRYERGFTNGNKFAVTYLAEGASSSQEFLYNNANPVLSTVSDKECRNIYVGFCGDGIVDNTSTKSSTSINAKLAG